MLEVQDVVEAVRATSKGLLSALQPLADEKGKEGTMTSKKDLDKARGKVDKAGAKFKKAVKGYDKKSKKHARGQ